MRRGTNWADFLAIYAHDCVPIRAGIYPPPVLFATYMGWLGISKRLQNETDGVTVFACGRTVDKLISVVIVHLEYSRRAREVGIWQFNR